MGERGTMDDGIRKWGAGWQAQVFVGRDPVTGKKKYRYKTFRTKKEAVAWRLKQRQEYQDTGTIFEPSKLSLQQYLAGWLKTIEPNVRPSTLEGYEIMVRKHIVPELGMVALAKLTPARVQIFYNEQRENVSSRVLQYIHATLHRAMEQAVKLDLIRSNPTARVEKPKHTSKKMGILSPEQVGRFIEFTRSHRLAALWLLACTTGMRRGELCGLRWQDVDLDGGWVTIRQQLTDVGGKRIFQEPKTKAGKRTIPLLPEVVDSLRGWKARQDMERTLAGPDWQETGLVFTGDTGKPLHPNNLVKRDFRGLLEKADLPAIRLHDLRHTVATYLASKGVPVNVIQLILGHSRASITSDVYAAHFTPHMARDAIACLRDILPDIPQEESQ